MAKFKDLDLRLNTDEKVIFGDSLQAHFTYTTISGYNTPSGVLSLTPIAEFVVNKPIAGEQATKPYHLVRYDQLEDALTNVNPLDWQESVKSFSTTPPGSPQPGDRYVVSASGTSGAFVGHENDVAEWNGTAWVFVDPNEGFTLRDEGRDEFYTFDGSTWGRFAATVDHSALSGLDTDDHEQYILVDGSRGFTGTVSGVYPVSDGDLATKKYVDDQIDSLAQSSDVVTITGAQTITGDKTFDNNLTTFLGDVFFDGITITMSGTTLNTKSGATFNFDETSTTNQSGKTNYTSTSSVDHESGSTETHESGSSDVYQAGSTITNSGTTTYADGSTIDHKSGSDDNYESGSDLTHESGSNETHDSGSNDTYKDGSNLTMSGTNVDVIGDSTMNFGDGTTLTHEDGSSEVYQNGSDTTHESGSNDTYLPGSNLTFSGTNVDVVGDTTMNFGGDTTTTYEDGSVINNNGDTIYGDTSNVTYSGAEVTYEGDTNITVNSGVETTYQDGSITNNYGDTIYGDTSTTVYQDGSEVTYSGAEVTYEGDSNITYGGDTTTTYEDNSVINNNGDTFYGDTSNTTFEDGSTVTFSGTTVFESTPVFNDGLTIASGTTLNLEGVTISGTFINPKQKWGKIAVINNARSQAVTFDTPWVDDNYVVVATLTNEVDSTPSIYSTIQGVKTGSGFTTHFSGKIDSGDFMLEWIAFYGQQK